MHTEDMIILLPFWGEVNHLVLDLTSNSEIDAGILEL